MHLIIIILLIAVAVLIWRASIGYTSIGYTSVNSNPTVNIWTSDLEKDTKENNDWRRVFATSDNLQVVGMSTPPGESLGMEVHPDNDQFFRVESGEALLHVEDSSGQSRVIYLSDGDAALVPHGLKHNITNVGSTPVKMYTVYGPPHHPGTRVDHTHADEIAREK